MYSFLRARDRVLSLEQSQVMGILNITPDSFSDGGRFGLKKSAKDNKRTGNGFAFDLDEVVRVAREMIQQGARILDVGGEATGPHSKAVGVEEELSRVMPVIKRLVQEIPQISSGEVWVSVDTYKPEVAKRALEAGASMVNDVTALRQGGAEMAQIIADHKAALVLMYAKDDTPRTSRKNVEYGNVVEHILAFLTDRVIFAREYGISDEHIVVDPGMGMFVSADPRYSLEILRRLSEFHSLGLPVLVGASCKGFIGEVLGGLPVSERLEGTLATVAISAWQGVKIVRVHDVKEGVRVVKMVDSIMSAT